MSIFGFKTKAAVAVLAMSASVAANASALSLMSISGLYSIFDGGAVLSPVASTVPNASTALGGNAAAPGGNVQLGAFGNSFGALTGIGNGHTITLSSLTLTDWTANGNALTNRYIQDAAVAAFGSPLTSSQLLTAVGNFFALPVDSASHKPWQLVSDPNISYVDVTGNVLTVGLAGLFDASPFLRAISGISLPDGEQASEVVKLSFDGSDPVYLYSFSATPSGVTFAGDPNRIKTIFTGNYEVTYVPEPATLALLGVGLLGLLTSRKRQS